MHHFRQAHNSDAIAEFAQNFLRLSLLMAISGCWIRRVFHGRKSLVPIEDQVRREKDKERAAFT